MCLESVGKGSLVYWVWLASWASLQCERFCVQGSILVRSAWISWDDARCSPERFAKPLSKTYDTEVSYRRRASFSALQQYDCSAHAAEFFLNRLPLCFYFSEFVIIVLFIFFRWPFCHFEFDRQRARSKQFRGGNVIGCDYECGVHKFVDKIFGELGIVKRCGTKGREKLCGIGHAWGVVNSVVLTSCFQEFLVFSHSHSIQAGLVPPAEVGGTNLLAD